jgi:hypothetical protein
MKPRVRVFDYIWDGVVYFEWPGHGCWRVDDLSVPDWKFIQDNCWVPFVGF